MIVARVKIMYVWNAEEYQRNSTNQQRWGADRIAGLKLTGNEHILDVGCGVGNITAMIAAHIPGGLAIGIDSSPDMIWQAQRNYPYRKYPNLSFVVKDASELDFNGEFDIVFSNACLHWVKNHVPVLQGIQRGLCSSGRAMLEMGGRDNAKYVLEVISSLMEKPKWHPYFKSFEFPYGFYGPEEYTIWLNEIGLIINRLELVPRDMVHGNSGKFAAWIRTTLLPYTQAVPLSLRETFIEEIVVEYLRRYPEDSDSIVHVFMSRLEVEAYKP
jgi:trans-aconitate 2-methyltransferase